MGWRAYNPSSPFIRSAGPNAERTQTDTRARPTLQAASQSPARAEAHRKQQRSFRRNPVTGKEPDHGEFSQSPATDRDWNDHHAGHDCEQDHRIGKRQREALRASDQPNDENRERMDQTSNAQDHGPL